MASRLCFIATSNSNKIYEEELFDFTYFNGFSLPQKQRSIVSLHDRIKSKYPNANILEISTKSTNPLGVQASAFNLQFYHEELGKNFNLENIFQSSKVFENGGPYHDLLRVEAKDAKRDDRLKTSGMLKYFELYGLKWSLEPKTLFYDWLYISAIRNSELVHKIIEYDFFTDIEFNHERSLNCQARSAAIFVSLYQKGILNEKLKDMDAFKSIYGYEKNLPEQLSIFDIL